MTWPPLKLNRRLPLSDIAIYNVEQWIAVKI